MPQHASDRKKKLAQQASCDHMWRDVSKGIFPPDIELICPKCVLTKAKKTPPEVPTEESIQKTSTISEPKTCKSSKTPTRSKGVTALRHIIRWIILIFAFIFATLIYAISKDTVTGVRLDTCKRGSGLTLVCLPHK